jgi:hypothetical protein
MMPAQRSGDAGQKEHDHMTARKFKTTAGPMMTEAEIERGNRINILNMRAPVQFDIRREIERTMDANPKATQEEIYNLLYGNRALVSAVLNNAIASALLDISGGVGRLVPKKAES